MLPTSKKNIASKLKFPLVMKIVSNDISHKSDSGGVVLGINSLNEVDRTYKSMIKAVKKHTKNSFFLFELFTETFTLTLCSLSKSLFRLSDVFEINELSISLKL